jgi:hypothetical protein
MTLFGLIQVTHAMVLNPSVVDQYWNKRPCEKEVILTEEVTREEIPEKATDKNIGEESEPRNSPTISRDRITNRVTFVQCLE